MESITVAQVVPEYSHDTVFEDAGWWFRVPDACRRCPLAPVRKVKYELGVGWNIHSSGWFYRTNGEYQLVRPITLLERLRLRWRWWRDGNHNKPHAVKHT